MAKPKEIRTEEISVEYKGKIYTGTMIVKGIRTLYLTVTYGGITEPCGIVDKGQIEGQAKYCLSEIARKLSEKDMQGV